MNRHAFTVILPAAGRSHRFGSGDKLLADLAGTSVLRRAAQLFTRRNDVPAIVVATSVDRIESYRRHLEPVLHGKSLVVVSGGQARWESVYFALINGAIRTDYVAVHDAARPLTPPGVIDAAFAGAVEYGAAVPVIPEPTTLKRLNGRQMVEATVDRTGLYQAQTPQCFRTLLLREAFEKLRALGPMASVTDDAQVVELTGGRVIGSTGSPRNMKITAGEDLSLARAWIGLGISGNEP